MLQKIIILGTGGTIAGWAADPSQPDRYQAAQLTVGRLLDALPQDPSPFQLEAEQLAQIDSKDMDEVTWRRLLARTLHHLRDPEVRAVVITHGTDTLEETAFLLSAVLPTDKPVILTGAMRAANSAEADGPRNLSDALVAAPDLPGGVWVVFSGQVHHASQVQKVHPTALDPYRSASGSAAAHIDLGKVQGTPTALRPEGVWPDPMQVLSSPWPRVALVLSHADAQPWWLTALLQRGTEPPWQGLVIAGTGNATWPQCWSDALTRLRSAGVKIWLSSRCGLGTATPALQNGLETVPWSPAQARVGLVLRLLTEAHAGRGP
jgi:L-asparaginase